MLYSIYHLIINTIAGILGGSLLLRFWMQAVRVRPPFAVAQFVFKLTDWLVRPLRKIMPGAGGYDWASLIGALLISVLGAAASYWMMPLFSAVPYLPMRLILLMALLHLITWIVYGFMALLILEVIFSWVNPNAPLAPFVQALNQPLLRPIRRIIPSLGGIDLSVLVAFLLLQIVLHVINSSFAYLA